MLHYPRTHCLDQQPGELLDRCTRARSNELWCRSRTCHIFLVCRSSLFNSALTCTISKPQACYHTSLPLPFSGLACLRYAPLSSTDSYVGVLAGERPAIHTADEMQYRGRSDIKSMKKNKMKPRRSHHWTPCSRTFTTLSCPATCGIKPEGMTGLKHIHYTSLMDPSLFTATPTVGIPHD